LRALSLIYFQNCLVFAASSSLYSTILSFWHFFSSGRGSGMKPPPDAAQQTRQAAADPGGERLGEAEIRSPDAQRKRLGAPAEKGLRQSKQRA
jgi:hypothetical protein